MKALRMAVATALLTTASVSAFAVSITPPTTGPVPLPSATTGSGVEVQVWDAATGTSIAEWLGINYADFLPTGTDANETIDFGTIGGSQFATLFGSATAGAVTFNVSASNSVTTGALSLLTTLAAGGNPASVTNSAVSSAITALNTAIGSRANGANSSPGTPNFTDQCYSGVNPCVGPTAASQGFGFINTAGDSYGGGLGQSASGTAGGAALKFFEITQANTTSRTGVPVVTNYAGVWSLSATGDLMYTVGSSAVPLPAALWLFASGILGLAGVARRRSGVAATA
jgi:hypothetical protein